MILRKSRNGSINMAIMTTNLDFFFFSLKEEKIEKILFEHINISKRVLLSPAVLPQLMQYDMKKQNTELTG